MPRGVQYATTSDGVRIAFVTAGSGRPLFWVPHFLASHVELEWEFPQRFIFALLSKRCQVIRFDGRGLGLSDRTVADISLEARMRDLDAVAEKLGLNDFDIVGVQGGGNLAVAYAAANPDRVGKLVLFNWATNFKDDEAASTRMRAVANLMENDWDMLTESIGGVSFGFRSPFAAGYGRLVQASATQEMGIRYGYELLGEDCQSLMSHVRAETLVLHSERSSYASPASARAASAGIANARLRSFEGDLPDHVDRVIEAIGEFVAPVEAASPSAGRALEATVAPSTSGLPGLLTARELDVLQLVVRGLSNREAATELVLSPRTIERHLENIYRKTGTRNRTEMAAYSLANKLVPETR